MNELKVFIGKILKFFWDGFTNSSPMVADEETERSLTEAEHDTAGKI